jgi:hypothetical protein
VGSRSESRGHAAGCPRSSRKPRILTDSPVSARSNCSNHSFVLDLCGRRRPSNVARRMRRQSVPTLPHGARPAARPAEASGPRNPLSTSAKRRHGPDRTDRHPRRLARRSRCSFCRTPLTGSRHSLRKRDRRGRLAGFFKLNYFYGSKGIRCTMVGNTTGEGW